MAKDCTLKDEETRYLIPVASPHTSEGVPGVGGGPLLLPLSPCPGKDMVDWL